MRLALCVLLMFAACSSHDDPKPAPANPDRANDDKIAKQTLDTVEDLKNRPPAPIPEADKQAAITPTALVGTWKIKHLIYIKDGVAGPPTQPIVDGTWSFDAKGVYHKRGGNEIDGTFVQTKAALSVSAMGIVLDYSVDKLTAKDLVVTNMIMKGMGTTTVLERVP